MFICFFVWVPREFRRGVISPGTGILGVCEPSDMGISSWILVLWKSSKCP